MFCGRRRSCAKHWPEAAATLILNDRADLAVLAEFDGVHVGQGDLSPEDARAWSAPTASSAFRRTPTSRCSAADSTGARTTSPSARSFATGTKADAEQVVGLEGVRRARALTAKPLVAIGGITRANARSVIEAGADSVAVISGLLAPGESVEQVARDFLELLR